MHPLQPVGRALTTTGEQTLELGVGGMDCTECSVHVREAIAALPGVRSVRVLVAAEKAIIQLDPQEVDVPAIRTAVEQAGYSLSDAERLHSSHPTGYHVWKRPLHCGAR